MSLPDVVMVPKAQMAAIARILETAQQVAADYEAIRRTEPCLALPVRLVGHLEGLKQAVSAIANTQGGCGS